jgi:hypothetical protein
LEQKLFAIPVSENRLFSLMAREQKLMIKFGLKSGAYPSPFWNMHLEDFRGASRYNNFRQ